MEIVNQFGLDPKLLIAQIINFVIVMWVLKKFLYKPILDLLKKREITIKEGLEQAENARVMLEKAADEEKAVLKAAQIQANKIIKESKDHARETLITAEENAKKQTDKLILEAKIQIQQEIEKAEMRLSENVSTLAINLLQKGSKEFFTTTDQESVVERFVKTLKKQKN